MVYIYKRLISIGLLLEYRVLLQSVYYKIFRLRGKCFKGRFFACELSCLWYRLSLSSLQGIKMLINDALAHIMILWVVMAGTMQGRGYRCRRSSGGFKSIQALGETRLFYLRHTDSTKITRMESSKPYISSHSA